MMLCNFCVCSLQLASSHSGLRATWRGFSMMQSAAIATLLILCIFPLTTIAAPLADNASTQKRSVLTSRNLCQHFSKTNGLSCGFHDSCSEEIFECNSEGFHIGYSKPRCEAIIQLQHSPDSCENCLNHKEIVEWAQRTEECFQPKLKDLAESWARKIVPLSSPDPQQCIDYEMEALEELKKCYEQEIYPVCDLISDVLNSSIVDDLQKLVSALAVGSYYQPLVHGHLRELISKCSADSAIETANAALLPVKIKTALFCAASSENDNTIDFVTFDSDYGMNCPSKEGFIYADSGEFSKIRDQFCQKNSPKEVNGEQRTHYRIIQWMQTPGSCHLTQDYYQFPYSPTSEFIFFKLDITDSTCGNGIREAGEVCDTFSEVLMGSKSEYGCDQSCRPLENFECSTSQLEVSSCSKSKCGDGMRSSLEQCDDGNNIPNDGCSADCIIEPLSECTELEYNSTSICKPVEQVSSSIVNDVTVTSVTTVQPSTTTISTSATTLVTTTTSSISTSSTVTVNQTPVNEPSNAPALSEQSSGSLSSIRTSSNTLLWVTVVSLFIYLLFLR